MIKPVETFRIINPILDISEKEIKDLENEITCPVLSQPLNEGVVLIPCTHRIQQSFAEKFFGKLKEEVCEKQGQKCPICPQIVTGYMNDRGMRDLIPKLFLLLAQLKTSENLPSDSINLKEIENLEAAISCPIMFDTLDKGDTLIRGNILIPCAHRIGEVATHQLFGALDCQKKGEKCPLCRSIVIKYLPDAGTKHLIKNLSSLLEKLKIFATTAPTIVDLIYDEEFEKLRPKYDIALEKSWPAIKEALEQSDLILPLPPLGSAAQTIRDFLKQILVRKQLTKIRSLNLSDNNLEILPFELNLFNGLEKLNLVFNQLTKFPATLHLPNLTDLNLYSNQLQEISATLNLPKLKNLNLRNNLIIKLPATLNLPNLRTLDLSYNQLIELSAILNFPNLRHFHAESNLLRECSILDLLKLESLSLSNNNNLMFIPPSILRTIPTDDPIYQRINAQINYRAYSPLAKLYQAMLRLEIPNRKMLTPLNEKDKNLIFEQVWIEANSPTPSEYQ